MPATHPPAFEPSDAGKRDLVELIRIGQLLRRSTASSCSPTSVVEYVRELRKDRDET